MFVVLYLVFKIIIFLGQFLIYLYALMYFFVFLYKVHVFTDDYCILFGL